MGILIDNKAKWMIIIFENLKTRHIHKTFVIENSIILEKHLS